MDMNFAVGDQLPEGAQPLDENKLPLAESVGLVSNPPAPEDIPQNCAIYVNMPDGRKIGMAEPKVSLSEDVARITKNLEFADLKRALLEEERVRSLLYITDIDGAQVDRPRDHLMRLKLEQDLGALGVAHVFAAYQTHFLSASELKITKK